jgi:hypothetical protein
VTVVQGVDTDVEVGVTMGDEVTTAVTFEFPETVEIVGDAAKAGWTVEQGDSFVRFSGGRLDPQSCALFPVRVRAEEAGSFRVRAYQTTESGATVEHPPEGDIFMQPDGSSLTVSHSGPPNEMFEQVLHVTPHEGGSNARVILIGATVLAGVLAAIYFVPRAGRPRP